MQIYKHRRSVDVDSPQNNPGGAMPGSNGKLVKMIDEKTAQK